MARKARSKPKTPAEIAAMKLAKRRQDFEAVGLQPEAADLPANEAVHVEREGQRNAERASRADAFEALKVGLAPGCYDAARRLERDILTRYGWTDRGRSGQRVDCTAGLTTDAKLKAGWRVDAVMGRLSYRDAWLLTELIVGHPDRPIWRQTVAYITGEEHTHAQAAVVRAATVNLREAYEADFPPKMLRAC